MSKKIFIWLLAIVLLITVSLAEAQPGKIFRIGYLESGTGSGSAVLVEAFRQELSKLGWIEGKNIIIEHRFDEQKPERLPELAADLVRRNVDLIVVGGNNAALAAKKATTTIPIVMASSGDPVELGLVASVARPGSNITGFSTLSPEVNTKRLEILKDAVPKLDRVGLLHQVRTTSGELQLKELRAAATALKLKLEEIRLPAEPVNFEGTFQTAQQKQVKAIMTTSSRRLFAERKRIVELPQNFGCLRSTFRRSLSMRAVSCPTGRTTLTYTAAPPLM
jgi:ABC-type uncharacterized transport system substrate-binding protein